MTILAGLFDRRSVSLVAAAKSRHRELAAVRGPTPTAGDHTRAVVSGALIAAAARMLYLLSLRFVHGRKRVNDCLRIFKTGQRSCVLQAWQEIVGERDSSLDDGSGSDSDQSFSRKFGS